MAPRILIIRAPGTNCDQETAYAFQLAGGCAEVVHINRWLQQPGLAEQFQILCFPGGFSYGDDVAAGRILANQVRQFLSDQVQHFRDSEKLILGICNGFQALLKSGILVPDNPQPQATLTWNDRGQFEDRWVHLKVASDRCVFLRGIEKMYLPMAHAEGKFVTSSDAVLQQLGENGQLALRYCDTAGRCDQPLPFPLNPNGSQANVAGICDATGRVFGLMPHPERHIHRTHHPHWTRRPAETEPDGLAVFKNAVNFFS